MPIMGGTVGAAWQLDGHYARRSTAELYRGGELLGTVRADELGRYRFTAIPLENGRIDLRVVLISPGGEVREERRTLYGDASGPAAGHGQYRVTAARVGDSIFPHALSGISQAQNRTEHVSEYQLGITGHLWLAASVADTQSKGFSNRGFFGMGLHSWSGSKFSANAEHGHPGRSRAELSAVPQPNLRSE